MMETFVADPNGTVTFGTAYRELVEWNKKHGHNLTESIIPQNFQKRVHGVYGFAAVTNAPRPRDEHGNMTPRRLAGTRLRNAEDQDKELEGEE